MNDAPRPRRGNGARQLARKIALQTVYSWQVNPREWQQLVAEFELNEEAPRADRDFYVELVRGVCEQSAELDVQLATWTDRPAAELDPVEHAALLLGLVELRAHLDVPFRVVISEAVSLAKRFGATDGHKFVNAVMDKAARELRPHEH
ncbi:MAG: transcription antitermination factor NusB [Pseudomonadota bacterium]